MNVSYADIIAAYILVFKRDMPKDLPFDTAGKQIMKARADWRRVFQACEDTRIALQRAGRQYPEYAEVAEGAKALVAA